MQHLRMLAPAAGEGPGAAAAPAAHPPQPAIASDGVVEGVRGGLDRALAANWDVKGPVVDVLLAVWILVSMSMAAATLATSASTLPLLLLAHLRAHLLPALTSACTCVTKPMCCLQLLGEHACHRLAHLHPLHALHLCCPYTCLHVLPCCCPNMLSVRCSVLP